MTYSRSGCAQQTSTQEICWQYLLLDQLAHDLVVKEVNGSPLDALRSVLLLLSTKSQLNENLLQLLIDVIDTKLLEAVFLQDQGKLIKSTKQKKKKLDEILKRK